MYRNRRNIYKKREYPDRNEYSAQKEAVIRTYADTTLIDNIINLICERDYSAEIDEKYILSPKKT